MEIRIERDELHRELKRVQRDIQALQDEHQVQTDLEGNNEQKEVVDASDELVHELLRTSASELGESSKTRWDLPLPVPPELESEEKMDELLQISEEALGGLKLHGVKKIDKSGTFELSGSAGQIEFSIEFKTKKQGERTIVSEFILKKIPQDCSQELKGLIDLASARSCVRTWLIGVSEYAFMLQEREQAFAEIRRLAPYGSCRKPESRRIQNFLEAVSDDGRKCIRLVWRAEWTLTPDNNEPNEFLEPHLEIKARSGFDAKNAEMLEDSEAFGILVRKHGVAGAMIILIKRMFN